MKHNSRSAAAVAAFAFSALALVFIPGTASADTSDSGRTKAQIEYDEREAGTAAPPAKRTNTSNSSNIPVAPDGGAAGWQLALSAAVGATFTGGVVLVARQASQHRQAVAA